MATATKKRATTPKSPDEEAKPKGLLAPTDPEVLALTPDNVSLHEGAIVRMHDWDDENKAYVANRAIDSDSPIVDPEHKPHGPGIWIVVQSLYMSKAGPALRGIEYSHDECPKHGGICDHNYVANRSFPLTYLVDPSVEIMKEEARKARKRDGRLRSAGGPGMCEHCGEQTGGGRFLAGHDAKLKSLLRAEALSNDEEMRQRATAELQIRAMNHKEDDPKSSKWWEEARGSDRAAVTKLVKQGEGFLRSRVAQRTATDPGRMSEILEREAGL